MHVPRCTLNNERFPIPPFYSLKALRQGSASAKGRFAETVQLSENSGSVFNTGTVVEDSISGYGPMIPANRLVRTRTLGGVGAGGRTPWLPDYGISNWKRTSFSVA